MRKACIAVNTGKGTLPCVDVNVVFEITVTSECSRTQVALEMVLARASAKVHFHMAAVLGHIGALPAGTHSALHGHEQMVLLQRCRREGTFRVSCLDKELRCGE